MHYTHDDYDMPTVITRGGFNRDLSGLAESRDEHLPTERGSMQGDDPDQGKVPAFAAKFAVPSEIGQAIDEELANSVTYLMTNNLEEKTLEDTAHKYPCPANCQLIDSPRVNQTIWDNLSTTTRTRDARIQKVQRSLTRGVNAFLHTLDPEITEAQQDALALLCNANYELNALRKELIRPDLNSKFTHLCKTTHPVTKYLFGDDLGKKVRELQDQHKAAAGVMKAAKHSRPLYHPYRLAAESSRRQFRDAGWMRSPTSGNPNRPFLGPRPAWRKRFQPPHTYTPTASRGSQLPAQRAGQGRK
ncbi:uncharacterized protein [Diadema setosum]|uniref:uncharacterized protein n=1 Tax=Diadema setosum TaxID=31175 RepID=UPI003B3AB007